MLRLMCVTAHPDDEAGGFGGTLRLCHDSGVETCVLCLTPGQAASHRGNARDDKELAEIRRREFAASCEILKVTRGVVLDYADGQLHRLDLYTVVCEITRFVREFRPQVMITFGPEGAITAHPDHSMASVFATLAYEWAGRSNRYPDHFKQELTPHRVQKLYYGTANFTLPERQPVSLPPITAQIDIAKYLDSKIAAFHAHSSQAPLFPIFENTVRQRGNYEFFHLAAAAYPGIARQETDLFDGVNEST
jgi:LmbE family N-acetylglucosaminyl deacetylase